MLKFKAVVSLIIACVVVLALVAIAFTLPPIREGRATLEIAAPPQDISEVVEDVEQQQKWRGQLAGIARTTEGWEEQTTNGERVNFRWTFRSVERLELSFVSSAGYSGQWRATLALTGTGTLVSVVEHARIENPITRLIARIFLIQTSLLPSI